MIGILLRCLAFLLFLAAALTGGVGGQSPADLVAFGLAAWVLSTLLDWYSPPPPRRP